MERNGGRGDGENERLSRKWSDGEGDTEGKGGDGEKTSE